MPQVVFNNNNNVFTFQDFNLPQDYMYQGLKK